MYVVAVLGEREDFRFIGFLKNVIAERGFKAECVFAGSVGVELIEKLYRERPDFLIIFSPGDFSVLRRLSLSADVLIPLKRNFCMSTPVKKDGFVILSSDDKKVFPFSLNKGLSLITCGLSSKASITISCIDEYEDKVQCCVQRRIATIRGGGFEVQEFPVKNAKRLEVDRVLIAVGLLIVTEALNVNMTSKI